MAEHALSKKTERIAVTVRRNGQDPIATHREVKKFFILVFFTALNTLLAGTMEHARSKRMANIGANVTKRNSVLIVRHILEMLVEKMETTRTQPTAGAS